MTPPLRRAGRSREWVVVLLVALVALVPVYAAFVPGQVFYFRDLHAFFWGYHAWFRNSVLSGESVLWDPYQALGQPGAANAARMCLFPPVALLRLLLPAILGFNMTVALPFPIAAAGAFLLFRRRVGLRGAAFGAAVYALAGPVVSTGNLVIIAWVAALAPWAVWSVDRLVERPSPSRFAVCAVLFALELLAGEPVTLAAVAATAVVYAAVIDRRAAPLVVGAGLAGLLLASVQAFPMFAVARQSVRVLGPSPDQWSLHPARLLEFAAPGLFGDPLAATPGDVVWLQAFNSGGTPYILSVYFGVPCLAVAVLGAWNARDRGLGLFWTVVAVASVVCALGAATPVYPALQFALPPLRYFRYPEKYLLVTALAVAALASYGVDALARTERCRTAAAWATLAAFGLAGAAALGWCAAAGALSPDVEILRAAAAAAVPRALAPTAAAALLLWFAASRPASARVAATALGCLVVGDLLSAGVGLNPTFDAANFAVPAWVDTVHTRPESRVYIAGHGCGQPCPDAPRVDVPPGVPKLPAFAAYGMRLVPVASAARVRESITVDVADMFPVEYRAASQAFLTSTPDLRALILRRMGVRWQVAPDPPYGASREVTTIESGGAMRLYETPCVPRASVVGRAVAASDSVEDAVDQFLRPYDELARVRITGEEPPAAGESGAGLPAVAELVEDRADRVVVRSDVPDGGGYLRLLDTYDADWVATVDGRPAPVVRADALFRAVRLAPGRHVVAFDYRPRAFRLGLAVSLATALALAAACVVGRRRGAAG